MAAAIRVGRLTRVSAVVADPGNPGQVMALFTDGPRPVRGWGRVLVAVNGTPEPDGARRLVAVPVPAHLADPLAAAAWTYDDPGHPIRCTPGVYALLTRRT